MNNRDIRVEAMRVGVKLWQIAEALGISEVTFSRRLRRELSPEEKAKIQLIILELSKAERE